MIEDIIHIDVRACELTLSEVLLEVKRMKAENPEREFFLDGDKHAIVSRPKEVLA